MVCSQLGMSAHYSEMYPSSRPVELSGMNPNHSTAAPVAVLVEDLYFASIISSAARHLDTAIRFLHRGEAIPGDAPVGIAGYPAALGLGASRARLRSRRGDR